MITKDRLNYKVLIPSAGLGTRLGEISKNLNKALVSIDNKPTISHVIEKFPEEVEIVVALGHKGDLVKDYLKMAHDNRKITFVEVDNYRGTGSGLGYSISEAKVGSNDFHTYDLSLRLNLAFPWAYISIGDAVSFNDYIHQDTSVVSNIIRSDVTNTMDIMVTKALGDFIPFLDPNKNLFLNFSYEKIISEANIMNYDYIADSYSFSFSKAFQLNK